MTGFWTPIFKILVRFLEIWRQTLADSLPSNFRQHLSLTRDRFLVLADDVLQSSLSASTSQHSLVVEISEKDLLRHKMRLPQSTKSELSRAVAIEAERVLPLHTSQLVTAFRAQTEPDEGGHVEVDLVATHRQTLEAILSVSEAETLSISAIQTPTFFDQPPIEFPVKAISQDRMKRNALAIAVGGLALYLMVLIPDVYGGRLNDTIESIDGKIQLARNATRNLATLQSEMRTKRELTQVIVGTKRARLVTNLIEALTIASPDHVVLESLRLEANRLFLAGTAIGPESWAITLEAVPGFENVVLLSARNSVNQEAQRFELRSEIVWEELVEGVQAS